MVAAGGSYYFAKRSINADREERAADVERRRQMREGNRSRDHAAPRHVVDSTPHGVKQKDTTLDHLSPSQDLAGDAAPLTHDQVEAAKKSRFEAAEPFRSRKGDRFS